MFLMSLRGSPLLVWVFCFVLWGCAEKSGLKPVHDEVIMAPYAFDLAYLRTLEAVELHPDWDLDQTLKEQGIIHIRNERYSSFADADLRRATLILKRVANHQTSIEFAKESQTVMGGDEVLKLIRERLALEPAKS